MKRVPIERKRPLKAKSFPHRLEPERPLATWCEVQLPRVCAGRAAHRHERKRRSQGGDGSRENTLDVCHGCHDWIHRNPSQAYAKGLLVEHWLDPATVSVSVGPGVLSMLVNDQSP